jgi:hypothetical protein
MTGVSSKQIIEGKHGKSTLMMKINLANFISAR